MKKYLRGIPVTRFLLFSFITLSVLLVVSKYSEYQRIRHAQSTLNELIVKSVRRQQILTSILKGSDYARVNILNILLNPGDKNNSLAENNIHKQVVRNNQDHQEYEALIEGQHEQELYNNVKQLRKLNSDSRKNVIQLINEGKYSDALALDEDQQSKFYDAFQQANVALEEYVIRRDGVKIKDAQAELIRIEKFSDWSNVALLFLLIGLGIIISRTIRILRDKNRKLAESERSYRMFTEQTNEIIEKCDADGKIIFANDSFKNKLEYDEEKLADLNLSDILVNSAQNLNKAQPGYENVVTNVSEVFVSKSGKKIYLEGNILLDYKDNKFVGSTGFFKDVTDKRTLEESLLTSEKKFRNLFDLAPIPMWVIDSGSLSFLLVNKAAVLHYGYSEEEFYAKTILDIRPKEDVPRVQEDIMNWIKETNGPDHYSKVKRGLYRHLKKSNEVVEVEIYNTPFILNNKKDILSIAIDVTERHRNEQRITKAIINAQEQERYEIGGELHDNVCQILAAAKMSLTILRSSLNPDGFGLYDKTKASILLATDEIRNLSHRLAPAFLDTNLKNAFESLLMSFNIEKKYETLLFFDKSLNGLSINHDVQLNLYRILQEQLKNIFKYAQGSIIEVDVLLHNDLKMRIADNGVGFDLHEVKSGIGLANMKRRAELFSGRIHIDSSPGGGCEVVVTIPLEEIS